MEAQRAEEPGALVLPAGPSERVAISRLTEDLSVRVDGPDPNHITVLADLDALPPIVVHRRSMQVVDGIHRVRAARLRGVEYVEAIFVDGDDTELLLMAVRLNAHHGLPLTHRDRAALILRILRDRPQWSDRRIAAAAGVSHKTVGAVRRRSTGEFPHLNGYGEGAGGRDRYRIAGRRRAAALIAQQPDASLRVIARQVGLSPATVMDVRHRLEKGLDPVAGAGEGAGARPTSRLGAGDSGIERPARPASEQAAPDPVEDPDQALTVLRADPSVRYTLVGRRLLAVLVETVALRPEILLRSLPVHSRGRFAVLARVAETTWSRVAAELERTDSLTDR